MTEPVGPQQQEGLREKHDRGGQGECRALDGAQAARAEMAGQPTVVGGVQPVEFAECRPVGHKGVQCTGTSLLWWHSPGFEFARERLEVEFEFAQDPEAVRNGHRQIPVQAAQRRLERAHAGTSRARRSIRMSPARISSTRFVSPLRCLRPRSVSE